MNRGERRFLVVLVVVLAVGLAGCAGGGSATPTEAEADGGGDGGSMDGSDGSSGGATPTAAPDTDGTATPTAAPTASATATPTATPNASGPTATDESAGPLLENLVSSPEEFRYRVETDTEEGTYVQVGRWHGEDHYASIESIGDMEQSYEIYRVDGELDTVIGGQCMDMESQQVRNPRNTSQEDYNLSERPIGTDTIDGEAVYVYEIETGQRIGTVTYYVDTESGYVRKMEFMQTTIEYWDFGSVEPVESPC